MKLFLIHLSFFYCVYYDAQDNPSCFDIDYGMYPNQLENTALDGSELEHITYTKRLPAKHNLSERDVVFTKRIWSTIELKEKMNHVLYYPEDANRNNWSLWQVIRYNIEVLPNLTMYGLGGREFDDSFKYPVKTTDSNYCTQMKEMLYYVEQSVQLNDDGEEIYDPESGDPIIKEFLIRIESKEIIKYKIKEDWFFDKQRSQMEKRIIGIAPVIHSKDENGDVKGTRTLFWLDFPECEYIFQNYKCFNTHNDSQPMSYSDLFRKRKFSSTIYKESNVFNREINTIHDGKEALIESEKVKRKHANQEHDLWEY